MMTRDTPPVRSDLPADSRAALAARRRWGLALVLLGAAWLIFELLSRGTLFGVGLGLGSEQTAAIAAQRFTVSRVELVGVNDQLTIVGGAGAEVQIAGVRHGFGWGAAAAAALDRVTVDVAQRGDTLYVEVRRQPWAWSFGRSPYADLELTLPAEVAFRASLVSGDVRLERLAAAGAVTTISGAVRGETTGGALELSTTSGDIELRDHAGPLRVASTSGDLVAAGRLDRPVVQMVSGDVDLRGVVGRAEIGTISGDVVIRGADGAALAIVTTSGDVAVDGLLASAEQRIETISGAVDLRLDPAADLRLDLTTTSGDLRADLPLSGLASARRSLSGALGAGSATLSVTTVSGDVRVGADR